MIGWLPLYYTPIAYTLHEFEKWALRDLNPGPADYESDALTTELSALFKTVPEWGFEPHNSIVLYKPPAHDGYLQPYSRALKVGCTGIEPVIYRLKVYALPIELTTRIESTPSTIRTCDPLLRRQMLYPAELWVHKKRAGGETRTRDNLIGNQILYQLSYTRIMLQAGLEPARPMVNKF